jgi:TusA-related sulfurtransferase
MRGTWLEPISRHLLDIRGAIAPITLLKVTQAFREMRTGETIEILVSDQDTRLDLFKVLPSSHYEIIEIKEKASFFRILLRKGRHNA